MVSARTVSEYFQLHKSDIVCSTVFGIPTPDPNKRVHVHGSHE